MQELVIHGGGNTSTKVLGRDHLGRERRLLVIKASGTDLATIDRNGFVEIYLDELLTLRGREAMDDEAMVAFVVRCQTQPRGARPSIETLLHAFLPATDVDHVHADAICALTNGANAAGTVRDALGPRVGFVEYIRPGFALARRVAELADHDAVVLAHHGLVTWGEGEASFARTIELVQQAEEYLTARQRTRVTAAPSEATPLAESFLLKLRGRLSRRGHVIVHVGRDRATANREDISRIADAGPATADHLLHIGPWPLLVEAEESIDEATEMFERRYRAYWERNRARAPRGTVMHDPRPRIVLVPGVGTLAIAESEQRARIVAAVAERSHAVAAATLDAFGEAVPLSERDLFDIDYWPLELAKLGARTQNELAGHVIIVTGAAGAIGRATALAVTHAGAHLVATDRDVTRLEDLAGRLAREGRSVLSVAGDICDEAFVEQLVSAAVGRYGGVDGAVSNAGVAVSGRLVDVTTADWQRSLDTNTTSHFMLTRRMLRAFATQGIGGSLVYIASKNAFDAGAGFGPYSVAKAAEVQIARLAAIEGGPLGVRANVVNPDAIFSGSRLWSDDLRRSRAEAHGVSVDDLEQFYAQRNLLRRVVRAEDVAEAAVFLLSDRSSRTTGSVIPVDGGLPAAFPR